MDVAIRDSLDRLIEDILESEIYVEYQRQLAVVKEDPGLKEQIDVFRTRNLELQTGGNATFEQLDRFEREFAEFRENPKVDRFLAAELALCRLYHVIDRKLVEAIKFE